MSGAHEGKSVEDLVAQLRQLGIATDDLPKDVKTLNAILEAKKKDEPPAARPKTILVIGQCGDGKSTLVNALMDDTPGVNDGPQAAGKCAAGVTKEITSLVGKQINGQEIRIMDTPGVGDSNVKIPQLVEMIQRALGDDTDQMIDGVIVTSTADAGRLNLGAQVVLKLVEEGMISEAGGDKWANIILVGTKKDRADEEDIEMFRDRTNMGPSGLPRGLAGIFFTAGGTTPLPGGQGQVAVVGAKGGKMNREDYAELEEAICKLPSTQIAYRKIEAVELATILADTLGMDQDALVQELKDIQEQMNRQRDEALAAQKQELQEEFDRKFEEADVETQKKMQQMEDDRKAAEALNAENQQKLQQKMEEQKAEQEKLILEQKAEALKLEQEMKAEMAQAQKKGAEEMEKIKAEQEKKRAEMLATIDKQQQQHKDEVKAQQYKIQQLENMKQQVQYIGGGGSGGGCGGGCGGYSGGGGGGRTIHTGPRGGRYFINGNGNKSYVPRR